MEGLLREEVVVLWWKEGVRNEPFSCRPCRRVDQDGPHEQVLVLLEEQAVVVESPYCVLWEETKREQTKMCASW